jgi:hypothetical protein
MMRAISSLKEARHLQPRTRCAPRVRHALRQSLALDRRIAVGGWITPVLRK